jgi:5-hydroxyisourate hydrolase-like protein (transthyretin family)
MSHRKLSLFFVFVLIFGQWSPAAAAPTNDNFASAETIHVFPFSAEPDISEATLEAEEPQNCLPPDRSVWYTFVAPATTVMLADARYETPPTISIYRATGSGMANLEFVQCASPGGAITFLVEAGQTYYVQVGILDGQPGNVQFSMSEVFEITGYVTDAGTGAPLPGSMPPFANVTLYSVCGESCLDPIRTVATFDDGQFRIDSYLGEEIPAGTYMLGVSANGYQTGQFGPYEFTGADLDVGVLALEPLPTIRSIHGRLIDVAAGKPVPDVFEPVVELYRCSDWDCLTLVNGQIPDREGRFHFETDNFGNPLTVGTYLVVAFADQYQLAQTELFEVKEGVQKNIGNLQIRSFPIRFSDVIPCGDIPLSGGDCVYSIRIWNGLATRLEGSTWSLAGSSLPNSPIGFTEFQTKEPRQLELQRGGSKVVHFKFQVPPSSELTDIGTCTRVFVGRGGNPLFNTIGYGEMFCFIRTAEGMTIAPPQTDALRQGLASFTASAPEVEPNNSCLEAQDVGAASLPFLMDGNLDSSAAPDVDFYRFSGAAGEPITIELAGQETGQGTLVDPLLGAFDSNCTLLALNDDFNSLNSRLTIQVPDDGTLILAATAYPDGEFLGGGNGTYQLTVSHVKAIGPIHGRLTDAVTGEPLPGDMPPFAYAILQRCDEFGCIDISGQSVGSDGSFSFENDPGGLPLEEGTYNVVAGAEQYEFAQTGSFDAHAGEEVNLGDIGLQPFPVQFSDPQGCIIASDGGICEFSVTMTNTRSTPVSGKVWNTVAGFELGSFVNFTTFQSNTPRDLRLGAGQSRTLHFRFRVAGRVADGATICPTAYIGHNPDAFFHPIGHSFLFCLVKGDSGFDLMSSAEAQAMSQQIQLQKLAPPEWVPDKKK